MKKNTLGTLLTGAAIGAGLGILFAPRKGSETRKKLGEKINELYKKVKELDYGEIKEDLVEKINEIKEELKDLDKEKALEIAKRKSEDIKKKIEELAVLAKQKSTPVIEQTIEDLRKTAIKMSKEITKKLEEKGQSKKNK